MFWCGNVVPAYRYYIFNWTVDSEEPGRDQGERQRYDMQQRSLTGKEPLHYCIRHTLQPFGCRSAPTIWKFDMMMSRGKVITIQPAGNMNVWCQLNPSNICWQPKLQAAGGTTWKIKDCLVIRIYPVETINVCTKFCSSPPRRCWDISMDYLNFNLCYTKR